MSQPNTTTTLALTLALGLCATLLAGCDTKSTASPTKAPTEGMILIPGGAFEMGGDAGEMDGDSHSHRSAYPIHEVHVDTFWIDEAEVTNRQFAEFVDETGYVTFAEQPLPERTVRELREAAEYSIKEHERQAKAATGREKEAILASLERIKEASKLIDKAGSIVFAAPKGELHDSRDINQWWRLMPGATWRTPGGPDTTLEGLDDHPVVNVTYEDAAAYAKWAGKRLPTETEWEKAARGGLVRQPYAWGNEMFPEGEEVWMANIWQGEWPFENTALDGHVTTSPVKSFPPNAYGLYDMAGNVWEIVSDYYHPAAYQMPSATEPNTKGPDASVAVQPGQRLSHQVTKGGSFLCSDVWCKGYQPGARQPFDNESPANHTGFRCAMDARPEDT